jgi:hypothetical protein
MAWLAITPPQQRPPLRGDHPSPIFQDRFCHFVVVAACSSSKGLRVN